ncbi:MAG: type III-A CRISPR-associated RAMP protein Csm4 [Bacteroidia bacterium]|nr:type III-A CRISPR-associated RAMP protein Csm4 [Bacteroidia bacterium]
MATLTLFRFQFHSPLHIGTHREDYSQSESMIHSDTLYAAIMHIWGALGWEVPANPGFTVSSLFPYTQSIENSVFVYFFPKPYFLPNQSQPDPGIDPKKIKKMAWIDKAYLEKYIAHTFTGFGEKGKNIQGKFLSEIKINDLFMQTETSPRVTLDRIGAEDAKPFYMERVYFANDSGLFGLFHFEDETAKAKVIAALKVLQDEGLGTDRTVGNGGFTLSREEPFEIKTPENGKYGMNLSLFCPEDKEQLSEMLGQNAKYDILKRGGWISKPPFNTFKKQETYMFREGSLFHLDFQQDITVAGSIREVQPAILQHDPKLNDAIKHPIYRVGKAIFLPVAIH